MGKELVKKSTEDSRVVFSGGFEHPEHELINIKISDIIECKTNHIVNNRGEIIFENSDVVIDFTTPETTIGNIELAKKTKTSLVIGTTGLTSEIYKMIKDVGNHVAVLQSTNMSLGVNLLFDLVKKTSSTLGENNYDIEISETHHKNKIDAPSGTAISLGKFAADGRNKNFDDIKVYDRTNSKEQRNKGDIGFSVTRGGEIAGEHIVSFIGKNDRIDLSHKAFNRSIFIKGAIEAAIFLSQKKNGVYSMEDIITA